MCIIFVFLLLVASSPNSISPILPSISDAEKTQSQDLEAVRRRLNETNPNPTFNPTANPTLEPTHNPTANPTFNPTAGPTNGPTNHPTANPSSNPTKNPTRRPSINPTANPSSNPTINPTAVPSINPVTSYPSVDPTVGPTMNTTTESSSNMHEELWSELNKINQDILAATMLLAAIPFTFFGGKYFNWIIFFIGFALAGYGVFSLCDSVLNLESDLSLYISLGVGVLGGGILSYAHKLSIFSTGAVAGTVLFQFVYIHIETYTNFQPEYYQYVIIVCVWSMLCGYLLYKTYTFLLGGFTAFLGGFMFASAISYLVKRVSSEEAGVMDVIEYFDYKDTRCDNYWCYLLAASWMTMFLAGLIKQYGLQKKYRSCCGKNNKKQDNLRLVEDSDSPQIIQLVVQDSGRGEPLLNRGGTDRSSKRNPGGGRVAFTL